MTDAGPYIYVTERMMARRDQWPETPAGTVTTESLAGHHAFWAAHILYTPATPLTDGFNGTTRNVALQNRQVRFLYDLVLLTNNSSTFELRYIADPRKGSLARVSLILLGKVFDADPRHAERLARGQWERVKALFPSEAPYPYSLVPIGSGEDLPDSPTQDSESFSHWFSPIPQDAFDTGSYRVVELRKSEDWSARHLPLHDVDYIPHPFVPPIDFTGMTELVEALSRQQRTAYIGVALRPQYLTPRERSEIARFSDYYARAAKGELVEADETLIAQRAMGLHAFDAYYRQRAELGKQVYGALNEQSTALALITVRVVAEKNDLPGLTAMMGQEIIANMGAEYPCRYEPVTPSTDTEFKWAMFNMRWLEMERWGISQRLAQYPDLSRLPFFVTMPEAVAAFRLPTSALVAQLRGIEVRDEPFTNVLTHVPHPDDANSLGRVTSKQQATAQPAPLDQVTFSAYYPRIIPVQTRRTLLVYAHLPELRPQIREEANLFRPMMGTVEPHEIAVASSQPISRDTYLTIVPECAGIAFNPPSMRLRWGGTQERAVFEFQAPRQLQGLAVNGEIDIYVEMLNVATLKLGFVCDDGDMGTSEKAESLALEQSTAPFYERIFASYSHADTAVVEACRRAYTALGMKVLIDTEDLRSGEEFTAALMTMINRATVFQLFWSDRAARSDFVRQEYLHARDLHRAPGFIRPVCWERPLTPAPAELAALKIHFKYIPLPAMNEESVLPTLESSAKVRGSVTAETSPEPPGSTIDVTVSPATLTAERPVDTERVGGVDNQDKSRLAPSPPVTGTSSKGARREWWPWKRQRH